MEEEFDGYECISQEQFMLRRLLAFMRSSQSLCTDTLCIDDATPPSPRNTNEGDGNFVMMTMLLCLMAVIMCFIRPESFMNLTTSKRPVQRGSGGGDDRDEQPPPPPPAIN